MTNYRGRTVIHMAANTFQPRHACRPTRDLVPALAESFATDAVITCGNCLRIIARAEELAYWFVDAVAQGEADAERNVAHSIAFGHTDMFAKIEFLRRMLPSRRRTVGYWFNRGDVEATGNAAYAVRRGELELAYWKKLAAEAELEAYTWNTAVEEYSIKVGVPTCRPHCQLVHDVAAAELDAHTEWEQQAAVLGMRVAD